MGVGGAIQLADLLRDPAAAATTPTLQGLHLSYNRIRDQGARALADALPWCPTLQELDLSSNQIKPGGAQTLADTLLTKCPSLQYLNLSWNLPHNSWVGAEAEAVLRAAWTSPLFVDGTTRKAGGLHLRR